MNLKTIGIIIFLIVLHSGVRGQDASVIYKNTVNSTITIETDDGIGSGFFVGQNVIATNYHVIENTNTAFVYTNNSNDKYKVLGYLGIDIKNDLVLLKVENLKRPAIKFAQNPVKPGNKIYVIGSPKGLPATISDGIVSGLREIEGNNLIQITAPISSGSSGGPVLNSTGQLIGISVGAIIAGQNLNFAVPKIYLEELIKLKYSSALSLSSLPKVKKDTYIEDGNYVELGNQIWMKKNLDVDKFRNGDLIPQATSKAEWDNASTSGKPAWCYPSGSSYSYDCGKIYNWYAVNDPRGISPIGWHVPTDQEWYALTSYLGLDAGAHLKSTFGWNNRGNGSDTYGFEAYPCGPRDDDGRLFTPGEVISWWTSSKASSNSSWIRTANSLNNKLLRFDYGHGFGYYVRCVKD
jgi:uncharacterized protein (TIGR02145 family)